MENNQQEQDDLEQLSEEEIASIDWISEHWDEFEEERKVIGPKIRAMLAKVREQEEQ